MNWTGWWQRLREWAGRLMVARSPPCPKPELPAWEPEPVLGGTAPAPSQDTASSPPPPEVRRPSLEELAHIYELERMKHDKWVKPKGAPKRKRKQKAGEEDVDPETEHVDPVEDDQQHPPARPIPILDGGLVPDEVQILPDHLIIDEHHEGGKVLYREPEFWGEFNFRDTILEQLERYFVYIRRMRNSDPQSYGLYRAVGAYLVPYSATDAAGWLRKEEGDIPWHKFTEEQLERLRNKHLPPHFNKVRASIRLRGLWHQSNYRAAGDAEGSSQQGMAVDTKVHVLHQVQDASSGMGAGSQGWKCLQAHHLVGQAS